MNIVRINVITKIKEIIAGNYYANNHFTARKSQCKHIVHNI